MKKSKFRIILMFAGLLHLLPFFLIPYAQLEGLMGGLGQLAGAIGMGDAYPEKLTGMAAIKMASVFGDDEAILLSVMFGLPVGTGILTLLANLIGKGKLSYVATILLSIVSAAGYGLAVIGLMDYAQVGYSSNPVVYIFLVLSIAQIIVSIIGMVKDKGNSAAEKTTSKDKAVKVGKKDGTITGVSGSYTGAVIPVKSGDTVVIGRDPANCSIVLKDEKASRKHCTITYNGENGMYSVTDLSVNGVYKNGDRLPEKTAVPMSAGSEIRIGKDGDVFRLG
jgi:hypothetical protein